MAGGHPAVLFDKDIAKRFDTGVVGPFEIAADVGIEGDEVDF